jgi:hypothetical protein
MRKLLLFLFIIIANHTMAQELNCTVQVIYSSKTQLTDPTVIQSMQQMVSDFLNTRKWTNDIYQNLERIQCSMVINLTQQLSTTQYNAQVTVSSNRPVYNSSYNTTLLNILDKNWTVTYSSYQPLQFSDNGNNSDFSALLAFYAYVIIGLDYDSFSPKGGTPYFQKAQNIVNEEQNSTVTGWTSISGTVNRYWLASNLLDNDYAPVRQAQYDYHRKGLDKMYDDPDDARAAITSALSAIDNVNQNFPNSMIIQQFFEAKQDELVNIFSGASSPEKTAAYNLLVKLDPTNTPKYQVILKNNQ